MKQQFGFFIFLMSFFIVLDIYVGVGLWSVISTFKTKYLFLTIFIVLSAIAYWGIYQSFSLWRSPVYPRPWLGNFLLGFAVLMSISKIIFSGLLLAQDLGRMGVGAFNFVYQVFQSEATQESLLPSRRDFLTNAALGIAAVPFFSMLYGITKGKYQYTVENISLQFKNLPEAFDGFKVVQISDIHAGSWDDIDEVAYGIQKIQDQNPDIILFTGDLVNSDKDEINPYMDLFASLKAPYGKYAVLGNHDYYGRPRDQNERAIYWKDFLSKYDDMGFTLLNNDNQRIERNGQQISLVGVENWGHSDYFPKKGDIDQSLRGVPADDFCIMMSHDPSHWSYKIIPHKRHIDLTLSGHTHGMQFGVKFKNLQWSPIQYRYKQWSGIYESEGQQLYVNRGFGFLGFPGRVGMWPEITVITLEKDV